MTVSQPILPPDETIGPYKVHPVASVFPLMEGPEFDELVEDIDLSGQRVPIVVYNGELLDGRNRLRACLKLGIAPVVTQYIPKPNVDIGGWIISINAMRRNLTPDQRVAVVDQAYEIVNALAQERMLAAGAAQGHRGAEGGRGHKKPPEMNSSQGVSEPKTRAKDAHSTVGQLAAKANVSRHKAAQAVTVKKHAPELLEEVKKGKLDLRTAAKRARAKAPSKPRKPRAVKVESVLKRAVAYFEKTRDRLPEEMRDAFRAEFIRTLERL